MNDILKTISQNHTAFQYYNANPKDKNTTDCVVRAIAAATGMTWEKTLMELTMCALQHKLMIHDPDLYTKYLKQIGWVKQKQPRKRNNKKYTGKEWVKQFKGDAIAHIGDHHIVYVTHGKVLDTWDSTDGIIGNYWTKG